MIKLVPSMLLLPLAVSGLLLGPSSCGCLEPAKDRDESRPAERQREQTEPEASKESKAPQATPGLPEVPEPLTAANLLGLREREGRFVIRSYKGKRLKDQQKRPVRIRPEGEAGGVKRWHLSIEGVLEARYEVGQDGVVRVPWQINHEEGVRVRYQPAMPLLPPLRDGQPDGKAVSRGECAVRITDLATGHEKAHGTCNWVLRWTQPPRGWQNVYTVQGEREMELSLARVQVERVTAYRPGEGRVYQELSRKVAALGMFGMGKGKRTMFRPDIPPRPAEAEASGQSEKSGQAVEPAP